MGGRSFVDRVEVLRDSWLERRELRELSASHDFESQFRLLATIYGWAASAVTDIKTVYADSLAIALSAAPGMSDGTPAFTVAFADRCLVTFSASEKRRAGASRWFVAVSISAGRGGAVDAAGPDRKTGSWTRGRLEDVLLSVLGAYERSLTEEARRGYPRLQSRGA